MPKQTNEVKMLTETELELIQILWELGEGTVSQVQQKLPAERPLAYTSISTILRILEQKEFLRTRKEGRGHIYIPAVSKPDYESRTVKHVVEKVFSGAPLSLAKQLVQTTKLSKKDLSELRALIEKAEKEA